MKAVRWCIVGFLSVAALAVGALPVFRTDFLKLAKVKPGGRIASAQCTLCHLPNGTKMNPFGADVKAAMKAVGSRKMTPEVLKKVMPRDSDKDGVTNDKEIKADTLPGDPKSKPAK